MSYPDEKHDEPEDELSPERSRRIAVMAIPHNKLSRFMRLCRRWHLRVDINRGATRHDTYTIVRVANTNGVIHHHLKGMYTNLLFRDHLHGC